MKKAKYSLFLLALAMVMTAGVGKAWAYFTTYASAAGSIAISMGDETEIEEEFSNWEKRVTITNKPDSEPVYIRAKAFGGGGYSLVYGGEGWELKEEGYYYYDKIVQGGESTSVLSVKIENVPETDVKDGTAFNVVVIYESTPVMYHEDGTPYADWNVVLDDGTSSFGEAQKEGQ